jgi:hypothetical protein
MNIREIGEIRRRVRRDRSNMTEIYGCYVNEGKEIVSQFRQSTAIMPENEAEKYFGLLRKSLSGTVGKNLIDICFETSQVAGSPEHQLLMDLRKTQLHDEQLRDAFFRKIIESVDLGSAYLILIGCDRYDVPFRSKDDHYQADNSDEVYTYLLCAICPVKLNKATLHYDAQSKEFHDGGASNVAASPEVGFLFPAFDNRATNIYNALYYTRNTKIGQDAFVAAIFNRPIPQPAQQQKKSFEALLTTALEDESSMDVVQSVHQELCQRIELHKESKVPDALLVCKDEVAQVLRECGVSQQHVAKFNVDYDAAFGFEAQLHPRNIIDNKRFEVKLPDVSIKVAPDRLDLVQTRVIDGVKYIMICADEDVEVNGVNIHIREECEAGV